LPIGAGVDEAGHLDERWKRQFTVKREGKTFVLYSGLLDLAVLQDEDLDRSFLRREDRGREERKGPEGRGENLLSHANKNPAP